MGETYICDECDERISSGYSVAWSRNLTDSAAGIHYSQNEVRNLCNDCWPGEQKTLTQKIRELL